VRLASCAARVEWVDRTVRSYCKQAQVQWQTASNISAKSAASISPPPRNVGTASIYSTARRHVPEDHNPNLLTRENLCETSRNVGK